MLKKILPLLSIFFLSACISVSVDAPLTEAPANFVTATLAPTKIGFVPQTLTPVPLITITPTVAITVPPNCKKGAVLLRDVTVDDGTKMKAGEKFTKTWEFQNTGTCPWVNYTLKFAAGDQMSAPLSAPVATTLSGDKVEISVDLIAPSSDGSYTGYFTLNDTDGKDLAIGIEKTFWVKIIVGNGAAPASTPAATGTPSASNGSNNNCAYSQNAGYVQDIVGRINAARRNEKLDALTISAELTSAAQSHSADMACHNFHDHTGSDGSWISDRLIRAGYSPSHYIEIIAIGTPQNAMDQWASLPDHWKAIIDPKSKEIGVGYAYYANSDFGGYITVDFGSR